MTHACVTLLTQMRNESLLYTIYSSQTLLLLRETHDLFIRDGTYADATLLPSIHNLFLQDLALAVRDMTHACDVSHADAT